MNGDEGVKLSFFNDFHILWKVLIFWKLSYPGKKTDRDKKELEDSAGDPHHQRGEAGHGEVLKWTCGVCTSNYIVLESVMSLVLLFCHPMPTKPP